MDILQTLRERLHPVLEILARLLGYERRREDILAIGLLSFVVSLCLLLYGHHVSKGVQEKWPNYEHCDYFIYGAIVHMAVTVPLLLSERCTRPDLVFVLFSLGIVLFSVPRYIICFMNTSMLQPIIQIRVGDFVIGIALVCLAIFWRR